MEISTILCVDNSGSTYACKKYWDKVSKLYNKIKPYRLIYWNYFAEEKYQFEIISEGGTEPECFIELLKEEGAPFNLVIVTDGEISDDSIQKCNELLTPELQSLINLTTIYYIGCETEMNIGFNIIYGRTKVIYYINDKKYKPYKKMDDVNIDEFMSPNFAISLIMKIKNIEATYPDQTNREACFADLRAELCRLYSKIENVTLDNSETIEQKLHKYFTNNQYQEFIDVILQDRKDVQIVSQQKTKMLNLFDSKIDLNISRMVAAPVIELQEIEIPGENESAWSEFEDLITMEPFNLPCLLVQCAAEPVIVEPIILKHPLRLLSEPSLVQNVLHLFEPNPIDYSTYRKLAFDSSGHTISPHTRTQCKGVFLLDATQMRAVKNNCRAVSGLFGTQNKVPGNLVLWNLLFTYLVYRYKLAGTEYEQPMREQILAYCRKFSTSITLTHQCQVMRRVPLEVCLWFCTQAAPRACPNAAHNVLRSPFGLELLQLYTDTYCVENSVENPYIEKLMQRTRRWAVWSYLLANRDRRQFADEVRAQYQNHCIHSNRFIFLPGVCVQPFKSRCNLIDADVVHTLYTNLTPTSRKFEDIDQFQTVPAPIEYDDQLGLSEDLTHVQINIKTCWPFVICPLTKQHWKNCIGVYDKKSESHIRLFHTYCSKYGKYPKHYMDLVLFFSQKMNYYTVKNKCIEDFKYVLVTIFKEVMNTYSCEEYLAIYGSHTSERIRLSKE